jgi:hypothetical protein
MNNPEYWKLENKILARLENISTYRRLTGHETLPNNRSYWTLCHYQPIEDGSEIIQLQAMGFLNKSQFHGIDWSEEVISKNRSWHPESNWYCGDWLKVIRGNDDFNPGLIYLDTTNFADGNAATRIVASTMHLCLPDTVLLVNVMMNDPHSGRTFMSEALPANISRSVGSLELKKWSARVESFVYNATGKTEMMTYIFHKQR